jgi:hypothetical protein
VLRHVVAPLAGGLLAVLALSSAHADEDYVQPSRAEADVDLNGFITAGDLGRVAANLGLAAQHAAPRTDVDGNGRVSAADLGWVGFFVGGVGRSKYVHPFSALSPWNRPIGSWAQYAPANLPRTNYVHENEIPLLSPSSPQRSVHHNGSALAACAAGTPWPHQIAIPDGLIIAEAQGEYRPNNAGGVLLSDGRTIREFQYAARCSGTGDLHVGATRCTLDIYGSGMGCFAAHGGSGLSGVGGSLRVWEVQGSGPIRHVLKLTLPSHVLSGCEEGHRWPARTADTGYDNPQSWQYYAGANCGLRMGSLLAIPPGVNCQTLVTATLARRICVALQDYGAYVVDVHPSWNTTCQCPRTDWRPMTINGEIGTAAPVGAVGSQVLTLFENLHVVTNNGESSVGGGGSPRAPLPPPIND